MMIFFLFSQREGAEASALGGLWRSGKGEDCFYFLEKSKERSVPRKRGDVKEIDDEDEEGGQKEDQGAPSQEVMNDRGEFETDTSYKVVEDHKAIGHNTIGISQRDIQPKDREGRKDKGFPRADPFFSKDKRETHGKEKERDAEGGNAKPTKNKVISA